MASIQELKGVIKETLERRGVLGQIQARLRAEVFSALDDQSERKPPLSNENMLINELIREYLEFNHYKYTASVLLAETGQPKTPLDREFLNSELNVRPDKRSSSIPLLYSVVSHFMDRKLNEHVVPAAASGATYPSQAGHQRGLVQGTKAKRSDYEAEDEARTSGLHIHVAKR